MKTGVRSTKVRVLLALVPAALMILQQPALAETQTFHVPYAAEQLNQCTGELVFLQGTANITFYVDQNPDNTFTVREHFNTSGVTGVGLASGDAYHYTQYDTERTYVIGPVATTDTLHHVAFIHMGEDDAHVPDDRHEFVRVFTTWNNGVPTAMQDVRFECR